MNPFAPSSVVFLSGLGATWSPIGPGRGVASSPIGPGSGAPASPIGPGYGSPWSPIGPGSGSPWSPIGPGGNSPWSPIGPGKPKRTAAQDDAQPGAPAWEGIDPAWTYGDPAALLSQALRKSRVRTALLSDAMASDAFIQSPIDPNPKSQPLWRWAPEFRMMAVSCELMGRVQTHGRSVWLCEPPGGTSHPAPALLWALPDTFDDVDWPEQVDAVLRAAVEREDRLPEILSQASSLWAFYQSITGVALDQAPALGELILAAEDWALKLLMLLKHSVAALRPVQVSSLVLPVIATPGHGSLPSGHATIAAMNAELVRLLMYGPADKARAAALDRLARRIAFNRVVAGVHFPIDSQAGYSLGQLLARTLAALAGEDVELRARLPQDVIRLHHRLQEVLPGDDAVEEPEPPSSQRLAPPGEARALRALWGEAKVQLARLRV
jgi:hypothetical protein